MTVKFEDIRCTAFSCFCDYPVCELLEYAIVAIVVRLREVAFRGELSEAECPQEVIDNELKVAIEKTKEELVKKAVDAALNKAGINPAHVDSEAHIESNTAKGRLQKFFKENTLEEQEYTMSDDKKTCKQVLAEADKEAKVVCFKRFSLND